MSVSELASRDRRALVYGGALFLVLVLAFKAVPAWLAWRSGSIAGAAELSAELGRSRLAIRGVRGALDTTEARVARLRAAAPTLLVVQTPSEAPAQLTDVIREAARLSGMEIETAESRVDSAGGPGLRHVVATVQGTADVAGLAALLYRLEGGEPVLAVREFSVQQQNVAVPSDGVEALRVRLSVEGLAMVRGDGRDEGTER